MRTSPDVEMERRAPWSCVVCDSATPLECVTRFVAAKRTFMREKARPEFEGARSVHRMVKATGLQIVRVAANHLDSLRAKRQKY